jgi:hypothetical protein
MRRAAVEELHAASLSGKRLLALWNALPGVEKRRKVGDRAALIDQLWAVVEMLPERNPTLNGRQKQGKVMAMLCRPEVGTVDDRHSVPLVRDVMAAIWFALKSTVTIRGQKWPRSPVPSTPRRQRPIRATRSRSGCPG